MTGQDSVTLLYSLCNVARVCGNDQHVQKNQIRNLEIPRRSGNISCGLRYFIFKLGKITTDEQRILSPRLFISAALLLPVSGRNIMVWKDFS